MQKVKAPRIELTHTGEPGGVCEKLQLIPPPVDFMVSIVEPAPVQFAVESEKHQKLTLIRQQLRAGKILLHWWSH